MYKVPIKFKSALYDGNVSVNWYGTIYLKDNTTAHFTYANIAEESGRIVKKCSESTEIGIGNAYASELSMQLKKLNIDRYAMHDAVIDLYAKIKTDALIIWEELKMYTWEESSMYTWDEITREVNFPMGKYIVKESMRTANDVKVTAYDFMVMFDTDLPSAMSTDAQTPFDWIAAACTACNVTIGTTRREAYQMPNGMRLLKFSNASAEVKTWRDVVAQAAEAMGCNAMIGRDGKLYVRQFENNVSDDLNAGMRYSSDFSDYQSYYTGIYLSYRDGGVQEYQRNTTSVSDTGLSYDLGYNCFLQINDDNARHEATKEIIDAMSGLIYAPFKVSLPFNPAYDLMDVLKFYDNQTACDDIAPITSITFRIGGKMDISCGGEDPSLINAQSKETKAIESLSSGSGYNDDFWMVIGSAPESASVTVQADTPTKIGEVLFYAKEALSMFEVNYTAAYVLNDASLVEAEVFVDNVSVYKTQENQLNGENRLTVTTGAETGTKGSHTVNVYLKVTGTTLNVYDNEDF